jgi:hypothetical protein
MAKPIITFAELRSVRRELVAADDARLRRVVAMVDSLPERGHADDLIAPLRPRLALLRPARPLTLVRVLFMPVDALLVAPTVWQPQTPAIPRSVLGTFGAIVQAGLDRATGAEVQRNLTGRTTAEPAATAEIGLSLWPAAAAVLARAPVPANWTAVTGLSGALYPALARPLAVLLAAGTALHRLAGLDEDHSQAEALRLLETAAAADAATMAMMLVVLLAALPQARNLLRLAEGIAAARPDGDRSVPERALEFLFRGLEASVSQPAPPARAADELRSAAVLLDELEAGANAAQRPGRLARVTAVRRKLQLACRECFVGAARELLAGAAQSADAAATPADDGRVMTLEAAAGDLRRLDAVGRRLGDASGFDGTLRAAAAKLAADTRLNAVDRLRLSEILLGPDAALAMLGDLG